LDLKFSKLTRECHGYSRNSIFDLFILIIIIILFTENDKTKWWKTSKNKKIKNELKFGLMTTWLEV